MSTVVRQLEPPDHARWDAYVAAHPEAHFGQRVAWQELTRRAYGVPSLAWLAEREGRVCGVLPLFRKGGGAPLLFSAPGGLLADDDEAAAALLEPARARVRDERLAMLELRDQRRAWPGLETSDEHVTMVLELTGSTAAQWTAFEPKLRNQIRKGERAGFTRAWGHDRVDAFHRVLLENMRDLGTPIRDTRYFRLALELMGSSADVLVIESAGEPAGAMFTVAHGTTLADPWASSLRRFYERCPNQVLYWEAIQRAIALGLKRFDFGRSQPGSGTFRFKEQWGARPVALHYQYALGTARAIPTLGEQKGAFALAARVWRTLPVAVAGLLGEPARRRFPEVM